MKKALLALAAVCTAAFSAFGQTTAPKYSNEFLSIGVGARAMGMGNSQVAIAQDVTAGYWNPAGLVHLRTNFEGSLQHAEYFAGIAAYDYAGFAARIDSVSAISISLIRFAVDDIPDTRFLYNNGVIDYSRIRKFSASDNALLVSYARKSLWVEGLHMGASFKIIHRNVGTFANSWGFGLDAGAQYQRKGWMFGLVLRDVTGTFNAWSHNTTEMAPVAEISGSEIPENSIEVTLPKLKFGVARHFKLPADMGLLVSTDLDFTFDGQRNVLVGSRLASIDPNMGLELDYKRIVFLRGGVTNIQQVQDFDRQKRTTIQPNFGLGIRIKSFYIDYALTDIGDRSESLYSNVFSLRLGF
jgi:hypothetical protein